MSRGARSEVEVHKDVVFGDAGERQLTCDIYFPLSTVEKEAALIFLHGGGFRGGSKETLGPRIRGYLDRGYVAIAAQYRLTDEARWPSQLHDVKTCLRWTRTNASWLGVQPDRIAIAGFSAGAILSLLAAGTNGRTEYEGDGGNTGTSSEVNACLAYYPSDVIPRDLGTGGTLLPQDAGDELYEAASPISYVSPNFPPTILFHGTADTTYAVDSSLRLLQALLEAKAPVEMHAFEGLPHIFDRDPKFMEECAAIGDVFLKRCLIDKGHIKSIEPEVTNDAV